MSTALAENKLNDKEQLTNIIEQWNANRLELFELTKPNDDLEFHGVMRFYFQDAGQKVATKCIRVSSTASTTDVIHSLIEKFRPDIRMLSVPEYALYEIHETGEERKLSDVEKPLLVQLNWHKDDREGRFLLRRMDEKTFLSGFEQHEPSNLRRKLSKREKKEKKKREKKEKLKEAEEANRDGIAERLYTELPETSFTRSISNPEAVMRRRRAQKFEKKLKELSEEGRCNAGGTLRIFGECLNKDVPYKTLLLSTKDTAAFVVQQILDKYRDIEKSLRDPENKTVEPPSNYCLVQMIVPSVPENNGIDNSHASSPGIREYILDDDDCPLAIKQQFPASRGTITFHIRRRPADYQPRKRKKKPKMKGELDAGFNKFDKILDKVPYLVEVNPNGTEIQGTAAKRYYLYMNLIEIGGEPTNMLNQGSNLQLFGPDIEAKHCFITQSDSTFSITPHSSEAEVFINGHRIVGSTVLRHGMLIGFGRKNAFKFFDPVQEEPIKPFANDVIDQAIQLNNIRQRRVSEDLTAITAGSQSRQSYETTFDADGNVETISTHSRDDRVSKKSDDNTGYVVTMNQANSRASEDMQNMATPQPRPNFEPNRSMLENNSKPGPQHIMHEPPYSPHQYYPGSIKKGDPILPAILELWEEGENVFLNMIISRLDPSKVKFKLAPTYTLYMATRYRASTHFKKISPEERAHRLTAFTNQVAAMIHQVIQDPYRDPGTLAFWLANSSELLHFLKQDRHLSPYTLDAQDYLAESVQQAFKIFVEYSQNELQSALLLFFEEPDKDGNEISKTSKILNALSNAMSLLRDCRVNAALTIQLFSQLLHFINMSLFNVLIGSTNYNYCSEQWGLILKSRLSMIGHWAHNHGIELAAECHLGRIVQATDLLIANKLALENLNDFNRHFFKLNSLQMRNILERFVPGPNEQPIPSEMIENVVKFVEINADEVARNEGREIKLEEDPDLKFPFLLPDDGYSCEVLYGIPSDLPEFIQPLVQNNLCRFTVQPTSCGEWTIYLISKSSKMMPQTPQYPPSDNGHRIYDNIHHPVRPVNYGIEPVHTNIPPPPPPLLSPHNIIRGQNPQMPMMYSPAMSSSSLSMGPGPGPYSAPAPNIMTIKLKKSESGLGLSIVAARNSNHEKLGIYIKSVVKGGAADMDGRLQAGDQLLKVDGNSLIDVPQEMAAKLMTQTDSIVTLEVAKQAASYNGLAPLLTDPNHISRGLNDQSFSGPVQYRQVIPSDRILRDLRAKEYYPNFQSSNINQHRAQSEAQLRDLLRQKAERESMIEELHRREERVLHSHGSQTLNPKLHSNSQLPIQTRSSHYNPSMGPPTSYTLHPKNFPFPGSKPISRIPMSQSNHFNLNDAIKGQDLLQNQKRTQSEASIRDLFRTGAKMEELMDEVHRGGERSVHPQMNYLVKPQMPMTGSLIRQSNNFPTQKLMPQSNAYHQQPLKLISYSDQEPSRVLTSANNITISQNNLKENVHPQPAVSYRYGRSGYPPKIGKPNSPRNSSSTVENNYNNNQEVVENELSLLSSKEKKEEDIPPPLPKSPPPPQSSNSISNSNSTSTSISSSSKKVSWNGVSSIGHISSENKTETEAYSHDDDHSFTLRDISEVLEMDEEAEPGNSRVGVTPNVIGAQEVYRDPRERIKAEKMKNQPQNTNIPGPEKLSFKEKMKIFALEK